MLQIERTVLLLLAAGKSERFGDVGSKLTTEFLGKPLGLHVAVALEDLPFLARLAVVADEALDYGAHRFETLRNADPARDMASSVRRGITRARELGADAVVIALADMPRVTAAHIQRLFDASNGGDSVIASSDGVSPKPPALFGRDRFEFLLGLTGDSGARDMVAAGRHVVTAPAELIDVDTPEELQRLQELVRAPEALTRPHSRRYQQD
ncbi:nucleotidyltransferase family protein [Sphingomonas aracearum]|uniref:Nucleotidyltransferase family protein n=1 Tax=Sphingomonas aracearum TaxID=2283317 RepID=A0A369VUR2_9SPHN|nr:nucleotidyltransferase family protein [Sphingomonas aracearum]RDE05395.1 nucleotidyltransferase family protein [Sphingomonas aracearum]